MRDAGKNLLHLSDKVAVLRMGRGELQNKGKFIQTESECLGQLFPFRQAAGLSALGMARVITMSLCLQRACPGGSGERGI